MNIIKTKLDGVLLIKPDIYEDFRGINMELHNDAVFRKHGINITFIQDNISVSSKGVLRGIHGDNYTWKLLSCLSGRVYFVVVNCNANAPDFGKWESFILSDTNRHQVLVPPLYGNAHLALSDSITMHYKLSAHYNLEDQFTYRWDDKRFNIWWSIKHPLLSDRDEVSHS